MDKMTLKFSIFDFRFSILKGIEAETPAWREIHSIRKSPGFSLVELLVVIAILAILLAVSLPSFRAVTGGYAVEQAGQEALQTLTMARDLALTKNRWTEVRVIKTPSAGGGEMYRTLQVWQRQDDGSFLPASRATHLPQAMAFSENAAISPLLQPGSTLSGSMKLAGADRSYRGILFRPDGAPDKNTLGSNAACLTVVSERDLETSTLPPNFRSLSINPVTGEVRMFRP
jgi:uncharacterized protein (TIGR02596 family)